MGCRKCGKNVKVETVGTVRKVTPRGHKNARPRVFAHRLPAAETDESLVDSGSGKGVSEGVVSPVERDSENLADSTE